MNLPTSHFSKGKSLFFLFILVSFGLTAQVGINTTSPTETLHVNGNARIDGALLPNNDAGTLGQLLQSGGPGNPTIWGPDLSNVTDITRYSVAGPDLAPNTVYSFTVPIAGVTTQSTAIITLEGLWPTDIFDDLTFHNIEMRTDEIRFSVSNNTTGIGSTTYLAAAYNITIIR